MPTVTVSVGTSHARRDLAMLREKTLESVSFRTVADELSHIDATMRDHGPPKRDTFVRDVAIPFNYTTLCDTH
jgi:hypothetical protein